MIKILNLYFLLQDAKTGKLRLLSCARTLLDEAIAKVKVNSYITRNGDEPTEIFTCGIGCSQFGPSINRELNVKYVITTILITSVGMACVSFKGPTKGHCNLYMIM